jgi:hypothetical protein
MEGLEERNQKNNEACTGKEKNRWTNWKKAKTEDRRRLKMGRSLSNAVAWRIPTMRSSHTPKNGGL